MAVHTVIGVMGGHDVPDDVLATAKELGAAIADNDWVLLTGGRDQGIMRAASLGAREAGGLVVGIQMNDAHDGDDAPGVDVMIRTGMGHGRNLLNVLSSHVVVALPGSYGTMSEVALAVANDRPVILLGFDDKGFFEDQVQPVPDVPSAIDAVKEALAQA